MHKPVSVATDSGATEFEESELPSLCAPYPFLQRKELRREGRPYSFFLHVLFKPNMVVKLQTTVVRCGTPLLEALALFSGSGGERVTCLLVSNEAGSLAGIVSESDVCKFLVSADPQSLLGAKIDCVIVPASKLVVIDTDTLTTTKPDELAACMVKKKIKHLPVVKTTGAVPLGIVDAITIAEHLIADSRATGQQDRAAIGSSLLTHTSALRWYEAGGSVQKALAAMVDSGTTALAICEGSTAGTGGTAPPKLAGLLTMSDILRKVLAVETKRGAWGEIPVSSIMTSADKVRCVDREELASGSGALRILKTMAEQKFRHAPVTEPVPVAAATGMLGRRFGSLVNNFAQSTGLGATRVVDILDILTTARMLLTSEMIDKVEAMERDRLMRLGPDGTTLVPLGKAEEARDRASSVATDASAATGASLVAEALGDGINEADGHRVINDGAQAAAGDGPFVLAAQAMNHKALSDLQAAYAAVPNGSKPTEKHLKRMAIVQGAMEKKLGALREELSANRSVGSFNEYLVCTSLCVNAHRAAAAWGIMLGQPQDELLTALGHVTRWATALRGAYALGGELGIVVLDEDGYPQPGQGVPLPGAAVSVRKGAADTGAPVVVHLQPRWCEAMQLDMVAGFLSQFLRDDMANAAARAGVEGAPEGSLRGWELEIRLVTLDRVQTWLEVTSGMDGPRLTAVAAAAAEAHVDSAGGAAGKQAMDACQQVWKVACFAREQVARAVELVLAAGPAQAATAAPANSSDTLTVSAILSSGATADGVGSLLQYLLRYLDLLQLLEPVVALLPLPPLPAAPVAAVAAGLAALGGPQGVASLCVQALAALTSLQCDALLAAPEATALRGVLLQCCVSPGDSELQARASTMEVPASKSDASRRREACFTFHRDASRTINLVSNLHTIASNGRGAAAGEGAVREAHAALCSALAIAAVVARPCEGGGEEIATALREACAWAASFPVYSKRRHVLAYAHSKKAGAADLAEAALRAEFPAIAKALARVALYGPSA